MHDSCDNADAMVHVFTCFTLRHEVVLCGWPFTGKVNAIHVYAFTELHFNTRFTEIRRVDRM